jgi:dipeptidyl aminopeptidase/acylaminoacyl peptidase
MAQLPDARFPAPSEPPLAHDDGPHPFGVHDLVAMERVGGPVPSPSGDVIAYTRKRWNTAKHAWGSSVWTFDLARWEAAGSVASRVGDFTKRITSRPLVADGNPTFSPDGRSLAFTSSRSGSSQIWVVELSGGEPRQLSDLALDVCDLTWSGSQMFFAARVWPGLGIQATADKEKELQERRQATGAHAMSFSSLPIRHWDEWLSGKRNHLFAAPLSRGDAGGGGGGGGGGAACR